jgi:regulator of protease activity HflC (stomatin/prohibitin superfamily)
VKAEFLDVSNARADMVRSVNEARGYAEQKIAESQADARQIVDTAERERGSRISSAKGSADRFIKLADQIQHDATTRGTTASQSRDLTLSRLYVETVREILGRVKSKVVLDGPQPANVLLPAK